MHGQTQIKFQDNLSSRVNMSSWPFKLEPVPKRRYGMNHCTLR